MNYEHYLIKKYGHSYKYLQYSTPECGGGDIDSCLMLTLPMPVLVDLYKEYYHIAPKTFMDCGAGFGYMVRWASLLKLDARGIEICKYPLMDSMYKKYFKNGRIQMCNLLDAEPFTQDLAYANTPFTYLAENEVDAAMFKFKNVKMLIAIHTTTEDIVAAKRFGTPIEYDNQIRLLRSNDWWLERFRKNGFDTTFDTRYSCFRAIPKTR